jgi:hypothetical protein
MHLTFNPPTPTFPDELILSDPDDNGSVRNWVDLLHRRAVIDFGKQGPVTDDKGRTQYPQKYANYYLRTAQTRDQVRDVGDFASLTDDQAKAVANGTAQARFENRIGDVALDSAGNPSDIGGEAWQGPNKDGVGGITFANPLSLWNAKKAAFQHNLNVGADGTSGGTGVDAGL